MTSITQNLIVKGQNKDELVKTGKIHVPPITIFPGPVLPNGKPIIDAEPQGPQTTP